MKLIVLLTLVLSVSCISKNNTEGQIKDGKILSNRPQNTTQFIALVRLKSPALLSVSSRVDGRTIIDENAKAALLAEQEAVIKQMTELSDKIKVIHQYRFVLNGIAFVAPIELKEKIISLNGIAYMENEAQFKRASTIKNLNTFKNNLKADILNINSVSYIGATKVHEQGIKGAGIKVGVLDSGIDFTHSMLGGSGDPLVFKDMDPNLETPHFPNAKVVGGIDLVGTEYNASSPEFSQRIPKPDKNPIDEGGHGTHVAGSIAGLGDGIKTYSGVAPEALLHAIKVFGANGSVGDGVIIAGLEYAIDPNGDLDTEDQLDVLNLSLGGSYGKEHLLYKEAIKNLVKGGVTTVIAAGNEGHNSYIVGSPSTTDEAISIAASIDNMDHNYKFDAVAFKTNEHEKLLFQVVEGNISTPISEAGDIKGKLVLTGTAATDLSDELKAALKGNIAFIDRGEVSFVDKLKRAFDAGAIGVVLANNVDGDAFQMGGEGKIDLPAIMITKALGDTLKEQMKLGDALIDFQVEDKIETPEIVDTLTSFSSRGPRMNDSHLKPEIAAPGYNIISASMGGGTEGVQMSGTSMATPHMAGVLALMTEKFPKLNPLELKSVVIATAKTMTDAKGKNYPIALQGSGRIQVDMAAAAKVIMTPSTLSLGEINLSTRKVIRKKIMVKNISETDLKLTPSFEISKELKIKTVEELVLKAGEETEITLDITISKPENNAASVEMDGRLLLKDGEVEVARIPMLAVVNRVSKINTNVSILATDVEDMAGSAVDVMVKNTGKNMGHALLFNLLGVDKRKVTEGEGNSTRTKGCDLQSAGYRVIERDGEKFFQVGVKLYNAISTWQGCEVSILLDGDNDGVADQELAGLMTQNLPGLQGLDFNSVLLDATKVRTMRSAYEVEYARALGAQEPLPEEDYVTAIVTGSQMMAYEHSTISVVEAPLSMLKKTLQGELSIKLAILNEDSAAIEADDFLGEMTKWKKINPTTDAMSFLDMPEVVEVEAGSSKTVSLTKGEGEEALLILYPMNRATKTHTRTDAQSELPNLIFGTGKKEPDDEKKHNKKEPDDDNE